MSEMRPFLLLVFTLVACGKADVKALELERMPVDNGCLGLVRGGPRTTCLVLEPSAPADLMFVVDNGPGSLALQRQLADAMPAFVDRVLESSLHYDLRIGFEAGDAQASLLRPKPCDAHSEDFTDLAACEAVCDGSKLEADNARWVELVAGEPVDRERLLETLRCGAMLGDAGPNAAEPLLSTLNAWASDEPFFRDRVRSAVLVTGGPECSRNRLQSAAGRDRDDARERCYASGSLCDELGCRIANLDHLGQETTDEEALLLPLSAFTDEVQDLINQYPYAEEPVRLHAIAPPMNGGDTGAVCDLDGTPLYPAVRLTVLGEESDLEVASACEADWGPHLRDVAANLADSHPMCVPGCVGDVDEEAPGLQVQCEFRADVPTQTGRIDQEYLPRCDDTRGSLGCWRPVTGDELHPICADAGFNLEIIVELVDPRESRMSILPRCVLSDDRASDCPDLP